MDNSKYNEMKLNNLLFKIKFAKKYWKEGIHLLFRTKRFGVNNEWHSEFDSLFGWSTKKIIFSILKVKPIIQNYQQMRFRAAGCYFLSEETNKKLGWYKYWKKGKENEKKNIYKNHR